MKILDLGQNLYINPEYIVKIEKSLQSYGDKQIYTIDIHLGIVPSNVLSSREILAFTTIDKRDDYFHYLFKLLNDDNTKEI